MCHNDVHTPLVFNFFFFLQIVRRPCVRIRVISLRSFFSHTHFALVKSLRMINDTRTIPCESHFPHDKTSTEIRLTDRKRVAATRRQNTHIIIDNLHGCCQHGLANAITFITDFVFISLNKY